MFCCTSTGETGIYWYYLRTLHLLLNASCPLLLSVTIAWGPWSPFITCIVNTSTRSPQHGVYIHMYTYHCTQRTKQTLYALSTILNTKLKYLSVAVMMYFSYTNLITWITLYSSHRILSILWPYLACINNWGLSNTSSFKDSETLHKVVSFLISQSQSDQCSPVTWSRVTVMTIHHIKTHSTLHFHHHECLAHADTFYYILTDLEVWIFKQDYYN